MPVFQQTFIFIARGHVVQCWTVNYCCHDELPKEGPCLHEAPTVYHQCWPTDGHLVSQSHHLLQVHPWIQKPMTNIWAFLTVWLFVILKSNPTWHLFWDILLRRGIWNDLMKENSTADIWEIWIMLFHLFNQAKKKLNERKETHKIPIHRTSQYNKIKL